MSEHVIWNLITVGKLHTVCATVAISALVCAIIVVFVMTLSLASGDDEWRPFAVVVAVSLAVGAAGALGYVLAPSAREAAAIKIVPALCESETIGELGAAAKSLALEWLEELRPPEEAAR